MEEPPAKRKPTSGEPPVVPVYIVHIKGLKYGELHLLSEDKDGEKKLAKLQEVKEMRLAQPPSSCHMMKEACDLIPDVIGEHHGFHWQCYKRFTMNLDRLKRTASSSQTTNVTQQRMSRRSSSDKIIFNPDCVFCGSENRKKIKVKGSWTSQGLSQFEYDGWKSVLEMAEKKTDDKLLTRIRGHDLFACEAKYRKNCRMQYMQKAEKWQSTNQEAKMYQINLEAAHKKAFEAVCKIVQKDVLQNLKILKLSDLRKIYIDILEDGEPSPISPCHFVAGDNN